MHVAVTIRLPDDPGVAKSCGIGALPGVQIPPAAHADARSDLELAAAAKGQETVDTVETPNKRGKDKDPDDGRGEIPVDFGCCTPRPRPKPSPLSKPYSRSDTWASTRHAMQNARFVLTVIVTSGNLSRAYATLSGAWR